MKFLSKTFGLRVILKPSYYKYYEGGRRERVAGLDAQFNNGVFETENQEIIKLLLKHKDYGIKFFSPDVQKRADEERLKEVKEAKKEQLEKSQTSCPYCAFNAKTASGLRLHMMAKHGIK